MKSRKAESNPEVISAPKVEVTPAATQSLVRKLRDQAQRASPERPEPPKRSRGGGAREFVESIVIALTLACLFRTFEAEAFVIPTGSMAPTLLGRHRDVTCEQCQYAYEVSASEEVDESGNLLHPNHWVAFSRCPNCQFINDLRGTRAFSGDRILVFKFPTDLRGILPDAVTQPQRWDVIVFKYPEDPETNYIKRVVVLPGEQPVLYDGDIYLKLPDSRYEVLRKPPVKVRAMAQVVFDNQYLPRDWLQNQWPLRWKPEPPEAWEVLDGGRRYRLREEAVRNLQLATLRYHHLVVIRGPGGTVKAPRPQLILDEYGYDSGFTDGQYRSEHHRHMRQHWVPDLGVRARVRIERVTGSITLELTETSDRFRAVFDLPSGQCSLYRNEQLLGTAPHPIRTRGRWTLEFFNFDNRLTVIVNGYQSLFGDGIDYDSFGLRAPTVPTEEDTRPVALRVHGCPLEVERLVVYRDIYYTHGDGLDAEWELTDTEAADPASWDRLRDKRPREFPQLGPDEFMMLGDNSPKSKDSRAWRDGPERWIGRLPGMESYGMDDRLAILQSRPGGEVVMAHRYFVHRQLLVGKAFLIYWPHGKPFSWSVSLGNHPEAVQIPFYPQLERMKLIY